MAPGSINDSSASSKLTLPSTTSTTTHDFEYPPTTIYVLFVFLSYSVLLNTIFHAYRHHYPAVDQASTKRLAWVVTGIASFTTTMLSIPFLRDWIEGGGSFGMVQKREWVAEGLCASFLSYLAM